MKNDAIAAHASLNKLILVTVILLLSCLAGCVDVAPSRPYGRRPVHAYEPPSTPSGVRYVIRKGDTLASLGRQYNVDWREILRANPSLLDVNNLQPGTVIVIPKASTPTTKEPPPFTGEVIKHNPGYTHRIAAEKTMVWPVRGRLLAKYGQVVSWRMGLKNNGIDIRAKSGERVVAAKSGRVNTFKSVPSLGKVVLLEHTDGSTTLYAHLDLILATHGRWVKQGETIAVAGSSGFASGTELHFRIMRGEKWVDPLRYLPK